MPKISIIVPVYNVEQYLKKCIDSILIQTFKNIEVILVNDGSTDNCGEICDEYLSKDPRVRVIHQKNEGLSEARNAGINIAKGEYIGFIDSDDWIEPTMYEILYSLSIKYNADISTCLIKHHGKNQKSNIEKSVNQVQVFNSQEAIERLYNNSLSGFIACNKLYKRNLFEDIKYPKGRVYEDAAVMYRLFDQASKIVFINEQLYNYNHRDQSITRSGFSEKRFDIVLNYFETYSFMEKNYPFMCEKINFIYFSSLRGMLVDIICEKSASRNTENIKKISRNIREVNNTILKNNIIPYKHKMLAQLLAWFPNVGLLFYKFFAKPN